MRLEFQVAKKYFFPQNRNFFRRISLISIVTVFLSVFLPMLILGILNGFHKSIENKLVSRDFHIQVLEKSDTFFDYKDLIAHMNKEHKGKVKGFPFFEGGAILAADLVKTTALVRGIVPEMRPFLKGFKTIEGKWIVDKSSVVLGSSIARRLRAKPGSIIKFYLRPYRKSGNTAPMILKRLKVSGIYQSGYDEIDDNVVFISFKKAQSFYNYGDRAWAVGFYLSDLKILNQVKKEITQYSFLLYARDWMQMNRNILFSFKWEKNIMILVLILIIIATLFSIYISFNVVVNDRKKEIGILKTLGMTNKKVQLIFYLKGLMIGSIGIVLGTLCAYVLLSNLENLLKALEQGLHFYGKFDFAYKESSYFRKGILYNWSFWDMFIVFILNICSILIATYFPVKRINKYNISESIRNA